MSSLRVMERNLAALRSGFWLTIVSGFFEPVFYLLSIGIGVGALVGPIDPGWGDVVPYAQFVAPAMLASSAMNGAVYDSTSNVFFKLKYSRTYESMLATPLRPIDIALGEIGWALLRGQLYAVGFLLVATILGLVHSGWALMALPTALLTGFAFAAAGMAVTTYLREWSDFEFLQLLMLPMFLLSATMFPVSTYPDALAAVVKLTPLYQGVTLSRDFMLGHLHAGMLGPALGLLAMGVLGSVVTMRRLRRLLLV